MKINRNRLIKQITYTLFIANIQFCLFVFIYYSFVLNETANTIKILLALEVVLFIISFYGIIHVNKTIYFGTLMFLLINSILLLTNHIGMVDLISLGLNGSLLLSLLTQFHIFVSHSIHR